MYGICHDCGIPITDYNGKALRPFAWDRDERWRYCFGCFYPDTCEVCGVDLECTDPQTLDIELLEAGRCESCFGLEYCEGANGYV